MPTLRFPGFTDEWQSFLLCDIAELSKGNGISKDKLSEDGSPCILYGELYTKYKSEVIDEVFSKTNSDEPNLVSSKAGDVIIPASGETAVDIATARCVEKSDILLGGDLNIIRLNYGDGKFLSYQLNGVRRYDIAKVAQGVSVVHLYGDRLSKIKVSIPSLEEQKKVSRFLTLLDKRIETQSKIIEDLEKLMSAIRKRVFFDLMVSYTPDKQIREALSYEQPTKYIVSDTEYSEDDTLIPVLTANKAFILGYTNETYGVYHRGECIIIDDFTLDCKFVDFPFKVKSSAIKILTAKSGISLRYIFEYLKYLELDTSEHKRHYITEIEPIEIIIPPKEEMDNIAQFFSVLDKRYDAVIRSLRMLQSQKQYLLRQMFI